MSKKLTYSTVHKEEFSEAKLLMEAYLISICSNGKNQEDTKCKFVLNFLQIKRHVIICLNDLMQVTAMVCSKLCIHIDVLVFGYYNIVSLRPGRYEIFDKANRLFKIFRDVRNCMRFFRH